MKPLEAIRRENENIAWKSRLGPKAKELLKLPCVDVNHFSGTVHVRLVSEFAVSFQQMEQEGIVLDLFEINHEEIFEKIKDAFHIKSLALEEIRNTGKISEETLKKLKGQL